MLEKVKRCLPYIKASGGGITVSGGEPLLQMEFLAGFLGLCKKNNIHTAVDTSAFYGPHNAQLLKKIVSLTDLFIVDIKAASEALHKKMTSRSLSEVLDFLRILESEKKPYWLRYVLVPGMNDSKKDILALKEILAGLECCEKFEFLPYHTLGRHKWEYMKLKYPLPDTLPAGPRQLKRAQLIFNGQAGAIRGR